MTDLPRDIERDLAALADGSSLTPERRERALERVRESRELQVALAEQQRVVELTKSVDARAPASLRLQVEAMLAPERQPRRGRTFATPRIGLAAAATLAVVVAAILAIGLSGGGSSRLSVQQAAALTLSPATMSAPAESKANRGQLTASVSDVPFPYWQDRFGWRSVGAREDRLAGRAVTTVFYANSEGRRIGYAIVSGRAPATHGGTIVWRWGVPFRLLTQDGATVVTWLRDGHLCVVSGREIGAQTLLSLASSSERPLTA